METIKTTINLPTSLAQQIDAMAATAGQSRTDVIAELLSIALGAANPMHATDRLADQISAGLSEIREVVAQASGAADQEINSGALPPKLALLLIEIAARVTQKDPAKLESTRSAYKKLYL
jgi:hypothetical protein